MNKVKPGIPVKVIKFNSHSLSCNWDHASVCRMQVLFLNRL